MSWDGIALHTFNMYIQISNVLGWHCTSYLGGVMLNRTKPQMYITEKIMIVHVFLPKVKQHAELKNGFADFLRHI